jgi:hypothetical protein
MEGEQRDSQMAAGKFAVAAQLGANRSSFSTVRDPPVRDK